MTEHADVAVIGAGAAGLMAAIHAARRAPERRVIALDGARQLGAKILIAGGGRCNVTHDSVDERAFAGSTPAAIRSVLRRFDVPQTVDFFREIGVPLKREETGKLFPVSDRARTVLDALLRAARAAGATILHPWRVERISKQGDDFAIDGSGGHLTAQRVILATGGMSLPKTGSDGFGYDLARNLGHTTSKQIFPALVPLLLPAGHDLLTLSGVSTEATVSVRATSGRRLQAFTGSVLCTHFGLSGPAILDISRFLLNARTEDAGAGLAINWFPEATFETLDATLCDLGGKSIVRELAGGLPQRLALALVESSGIEPGATGSQLQRAQRRALVRALSEMPLPITGSRGFKYAEVTAGGIPLDQLILGRMESRLCPGLHLIGEICDVDGRIGGYNFQWAWASGYTAGVATAAAVASSSP